MFSILFKFMVFVASSLLVTVFVYYVNTVHLLDFYIQWWLDDVSNLPRYDYIVVGAGSAGAVIAVKLADYGHRVLLVEAGGTAPTFLDIPLLTPLIQETNYDWQHRTVPQLHACKALENNASKWPMGKILGGSSRLNYMAYVRGHPLDYHQWFPDFADPTENKGGPMKINVMKYNTELADAIVEGVLELGHQVGNINENLNIGFMKTHSSMENGKRWSTDKLLYKSHNLRIITHAHVNKVLIDSKRAKGIKFTKFNKNFIVESTKGIILSAGAIGSPKLLMLSGIGPKKHLESLQIKVIHDLPVGENLVDHILTGLDLVTINKTLPLNLAHALSPLAAWQYFHAKEGPWTSSGLEVLGTFHGESSNDSLPNLQLMVSPLGISQDNGIAFKKQMGISTKTYEEYFSHLSNENAISIAPVLLHPKSFGHVKLSSANPFDKPLIDPKYLSNEEDISVLIQGIQFIKKLIETRSMRALGASLYKKKFPGCEQFKFDSHEYWKCYVQHLTLTSYHPAGTCRINDVVDSSFRVFNMKNLYVVDASVLPILPSGNIHAAVIMIAEKAAGLLGKSSKKSSWKLNECHKYDFTKINEWVCYD